MELDAYLRRIGFEGVPRADFATLDALHRAHLNAIPYENLDVVLKRPSGLDVARAFDKLVTHKRGGWCYEMNGLLAWALEQIGFEVTRMAGAVGRAARGDAFVGNHLVLLVELEERIVADVGFGDGLHAPVALRQGPVAQDGFHSRLELMDDNWWRYHNHQNGGAPDFDFRAEPADPDVLARMCAFLQQSEASPFTQNVVAQRRLPDRVEVLRNSLRLTVHPDRVERRVLGSAEEFMDELRDAFGLEVPEARTLWPLADARGRAMLAEEAN